MGVGVICNLLEEAVKTWVFLVAAKGVIVHPSDFFLHLHESIALHFIESVITNLRCKFLPILGTLCTVLL